MLYMSDHYPCIVLVNLGNKIPTKEMRQFRTRNHTDDAIEQINTDLLMTDWTDLHQLTTNMAHNFFNRMFIVIMDKHPPNVPRNATSFIKMQLARRKMCQRVRNMYSIEMASIG